MFQTDVERLRKLVARNISCSVNAGSLAGRFGRRVREFAVELVREGLAHDVASDSHDESRRPPGLRAPIAAAEEFLPGLLEAADWYTRAAPAALLAGRNLPARPDLVAPEPDQPQSRFRRLLGRPRD
jgi:protein-tyrosine phosphatase